MSNCKKKENLVKLQLYMKREHNDIKKIKLTNTNKKR